MSATIELKEILILASVPVTLAILVMLYRHRERIIAILKTVVVLSCIGGIGACAYWYAPEPQVIEKIVKVAVPVAVEREKKSILQALEQTAPKYQVPKPVWEIVLLKESGGKMNSIKFESHYLGRAAKLTANKEEQRMYASSHCSMQVMGTLAHEYGYKWNDLYDPQICAEVSLAYLGKCLDRHKTKDKYDQIYNAFKCYNGGDSYAKDGMERLARRIINEGGL